MSYESEFKNEGAIYQFYQKKNPALEHEGAYNNARCHRTFQYNDCMVDTL